MKAIRILKILLKDTIMRREREYIQEAIKELEELENKKCENCKHYDLIMPQNNPHDQYNYLGCLKAVNKINECSLFYKSKYESKET